MLETKISLNQVTIISQAKLKKNIPGMKDKVEQILYSDFNKKKKTEKRDQLKESMGIDRMKYKVKEYKTSSMK